MGFCDIWWQEKHCSNPNCATFWDKLASSTGTLFSSINSNYRVIKYTIWGESKKTNAWYPAENNMAMENHQIFNRTKVPPRFHQGSSKGGPRFHYVLGFPLELPQGSVEGSNKVSPRFDLHRRRVDLFFPNSVGFGVFSRSRHRQGLGANFSSTVPCTKSLFPPKRFGGGFPPSCLYICLRGSPNSVLHFSPDLLWFSGAVSWGRSLSASEKFCAGFPHHFFTFGSQFLQLFWCILRQQP